MTGVIYARYSSDNQREESIEGQIRENTAFAEKNGITIVGHHIDRAFSAKTDNRPEFQRMIRDSAKETFEIVQQRMAKNKRAAAKNKAKEQILFVLDKFRKLDLILEQNKERLIDSLVKCVLLYDDKLVITLNYKNEPITVSTTDELDEVEKISDTEAFASPTTRKHHNSGAFSLR